MLNLTFYKNVPLQSSYANVVLFRSTSDVLAYLSQYQDGTLDNINKFFSNETFIDVPQYFEGCNYLCIQDTRSIAKEYKFFFIENVQFISGGAVRYSLIMDVWATWSYEITFKPSRMITGHADAFGISGIKRHLIGELNGTANMSMNKYLINTWAISKNATIFVCATTAAGPHIFFTNVTSDHYLLQALQMLEENKFKTSDAGEWYSFQNLKTYIVNEFNFKNVCDAIAPHLAIYSTIVMGYGSIGDAHLPQWYDYTNSGYYDENTPVNITTLKHEIKRIALFNPQTYNERTNLLKYTYKIGTMLTNQDFNVNSESNNYLQLDIHIFRRNQIAFYIKCGNVLINITNDFQIPIVNDSYTLYMSQNQATIDANNKANMVSLATALGMSALSLALAPATAGASAMIGAGAIGNIINYGVTNMKRDASIEGAKNTLDRTDGLYSAGLITLNEGVGLLRIEYQNIEDTNTNINNFGTLQKVFINTYKTNNASLYNFYFVQFDDINIYGEFTYNIKSILENIFTNGVRIWCDASQYLNNVNYKK